MERILVSSCLLGRPVRYDGSDKLSGDPLMLRWRAEGRLVPCCPEVAGGLPVPRPAAEITNLPNVSEPFIVHDKNGVDVTQFFWDGARRALEIAQAHDIKIAVLKDGSPSCGSSRIYDGTFTGRSIQGQGVTAALLSRSGIAVFGEHELGAVDAHIRELERCP